MIKINTDSGEHTDGDGCATYDSDYWVKVDGEDVCITDLKAGDVFTDFDGEWVAGSVARVGDDDVHVDIESVDGAE